MIVIDADRCRRELAFNRLVPALAEGARGASVKVTLLKCAS